MPSRRAMRIDPLPARGPPSRAGSRDIHAMVPDSVRDEIETMTDRDDESHRRARGGVGPSRGSRGRLGNSPETRTRARELDDRGDDSPSVDQLTLAFNAMPGTDPGRDHSSSSPSSSSNMPFLAFSIRSLS